MDNNKLNESIELLTKEIQRLQTSINSSQLQPLYTNKGIIALLQINTSTLRKYRDEGLLGFTKVGDKYFYTANDVKRFLDTNHYEPFAS